MAQQHAEYHVKYAGAGWQVFDRDAQVVSRPLSAQLDAVLHAKQLARFHGIAKIVVYGEHDSVISQFHYQRAAHAEAADPFSTSAKRTT